MYRSAPGNCAGRQSAPAAPLSPQAALARSDLPMKGDALQAALKRNGYAAGQVQFIVVSGPATADDAMAVLRQRYCRALLNGDVSDIGVSRNANTWHVVLARPLVRRDLADWRNAAKEVLKLTNDARRQSRTCGNRRFRPAPPLAWNEKLAAAALAHSRDMATQNYFSHTGKDRRTVADRATREGYRWRSVGENIATGQSSPQEVVTGWLTSPSHCANMMEPRFTDMGAAYAVNQKSDTVIYWTQVLGTLAR
jgi:uncharacterized protein YkwD